MAARACLMAVAHDILPTILERLPKDVALVAKKECFDRPISILRLEGAGLPEWCNEPANGAEFAWAAGIIGGDGVLRLLPASAIPPSSMPVQSCYEKLSESFNKPTN